MANSNLGHATAYGYAKSQGYTGTEAEFAALMASYATIGQQAAQSAADAAGSASDASDAKTAAQYAQGQAEAAQVAAETAETNAGNSATTANTKAGEAATSATAASGSATTAATYQANSEAWAVGTKNGTAVESTDDQYHNNSKYYAEQAAAVAASIPEDYSTLSADVTQVKQDLTSKISLNDYENIELTWTQGRYISRSGNANSGSSSLWATLDFIPIYKDTTLHILCYASGSADNVVIYEADKSTVRAYYNPTAEIKIDVTADGYIRLTNSPSYIPESTCYLKMCKNQNSNILDNIRDHALSADGYVDINYNLTGVTTNYQISLETGLLTKANGFGTTDFIPVISGASYKFFRGSGLSERVAFYDAERTMISTVSVSDNVDDITVPENASIKYMRVSVSGNVGSFALKVVPSDKRRYVVTPSEGLLAGVKNAYAEMATEIIVSAGNYDILQEYKDFYGNDYFTNYTQDYNGHVNGSWDYGIWLEDIDILFSPGAVVTALYDGSNTYASYYFSAFACGDNVTIDGLQLNCTNLRYGIHPDFWVNQERSKLTIRNCDLHNYRANDETEDNNSAIGAGFPLHGDWLFENLIVRSDTTNRVIRIHNYNSSEAQSHLVIKNCYIVGNGHIEVNSYSTSTAITEAIITGCSWINPPTTKIEGSGTPVNVQLYCFNNEQRDT